MTSGVKNAMERFYRDKAPKMDLPKAKKKKRAKGDLSEEQIQNRVVSALRKLGIFVFSIPMGGKRDAIGASRLKRSGALAGTPDLMVLDPPYQGANGVFWELKKKGGRVSKEQTEFMKRASSLGHLCVVATGLDANMKLVEILYHGSKSEQQILQSIEETEGLQCIG